MQRFSINLLARLLTALLLIIVIRSLAEVFRLEYLRGEALAYGEVRPFILGALAATLSLAIALLAIWAARPGIATVLICFTLAGLFVYRVYFFPPASAPPAPAPAAITPPA
jgi:hypothetical protein